MGKFNPALLKLARENLEKQMSKEGFMPMDPATAKQAQPMPPGGAPMPPGGAPMPPAGGAPMPPGGGAPMPAGAGGAPMPPGMPTPEMGGAPMPPGGGAPMPEDPPVTMSMLQELVPMIAEQVAQMVKEEGGGEGPAETTSPKTERIEEIGSKLDQVIELLGGGEGSPIPPGEAALPADAGPIPPEGQMPVPEGVPPELLAMMGGSGDPTGMGAEMGVGMPPQASAAAGPLAPGMEVQASEHDDNALRADQARNRASSLANLTARLRRG